MKYYGRKSTSMMFTVVASIHPILMSNHTEFLTVILLMFKYLFLKLAYFPIGRLIAIKLALFVISALFVAIVLVYP